MAYRCINAFSTATRVVAHGALIDDDDSILDTHGIHFAHVDVPSAPAGEVASTDAPRAKPPRKQPTKKAGPNPTGESKDNGDASTAPVEQ